MKIGIVVDNELYNDKRVLREAQILKDHGYEVFALCYRFDSKVQKEIEGLDVTRVNINRRLKDFLFLIFNTVPIYERLWSSWITWFIRNKNLDIIHTHDLYMAKSSAAAIRRSGRKVKLVLDLHENFAFQVTTYNWTKGLLRNILSRPRLWKQKEQEYLNYADRIVVLSEEFRDELMCRYSGLAKDIFCSLPNVPDVEQMSSFVADASLVPFRKRRPVIFYFGIVAERRGIFTALESFERVIKRGNDADFMIIGPVDRKDSSEFNRIISAKAIADRVIYIPWIELSSLPSYLEFSDICIAPFLKNPQHESGVANKIYDYMLGKRPVIASDCKPQKILIEKYKCGIIYENDSELDEAIIHLLNREDIRSEMGNNGYLAVVNELNTEKIKEALLSLYSGLEI